MVYNIPFCYLPNSKYQPIDTATSKLTEFQIAFIGTTSMRPDFAYFVICGCTKEEGNGKTEVIVFDDIERPHDITWYDKAGGFHHIRVGRDRVLKRRHLELPSWHAPVPLDSVVYTSRCF